MTQPKITWQNEDIAVEPLLDPMLDDIGIIPGPAREATKKYLIDLIKEDVEANITPEMTMGETNTTAIYFYDGFHAGQGIEPVYR